MNTMAETSGTRRAGTLLPLAAAAVVAFLCLYHLTAYPLTWYDEGSHLHVPKTLVQHGVYADVSSEGFRYYGPTIGVGPTVLLPIAAVFSVAGVGLLQARLVMVAYLLAAVVVFWLLASRLGGRTLAWAATALLVSSRGVGLLENGRQVLGEVPGFFFIGAGLLLWFAAWELASWRRLIAVGLLLGLAVVTKTQFMIVLAPALLLAWLANLVYYRSAPQRIFVIPGLIVGVCFTLWQAYVVVFLGPGTASDNLALYRAATASAATVFSPALMKRAVTELLSLRVYLGWLLPVLLYGLFLAAPRRPHAQKWGVLLLIVAVNLTWYVVASVSWIRYAFPALAIGSLFVARFFHDLTDGFRLGKAPAGEESGGVPQHGLRVALLVTLLAMILVPLGQTAKAIAFPAPNDPLAMAAHLKEHVPVSATIETWEPELGFLTNHRYHFPPQRSLYVAVNHIWLNGPSPADSYRFDQDGAPDYVLVGGFARWVGMYPTEKLADAYAPVATIGPYQLFARKP